MNNKDATVNESGGAAAAAAASTTGTATVVPVPVETAESPTLGVAADDCKPSATSSSSHSPVGVQSPPTSPWQQPVHATSIPEHLLDSARHERSSVPPTVASAAARPTFVTQQNRNECNAALVGQDLGLMEPSKYDELFELCEQSADNRFYDGLSMNQYSLRTLPDGRCLLMVERVFKGKTIQKIVFKQVSRDALLATLEEVYVLHLAQGGRAAKGHARGFGETLSYSTTIKSTVLLATAGRANVYGWWERERPKMNQEEAKRTRDQRDYCLPISLPPTDDTQPPTQQATLALPPSHAASSQNHAPSVSHDGGSSALVNREHSSNAVIGLETREHRGSNNVVGQLLQALTTQRSGGAVLNMGTLNIVGVQNNTTSTTGGGNQGNDGANEPSNADLMRAIKEGNVEIKKEQTNLLQTIKKTQRKPPRSENSPDMTPVNFDERLRPTTTAGISVANTAWHSPPAYTTTAAAGESDRKPAAAERRHVEVPVVETVGSDDSVSIDSTSVADDEKAPGEFGCPTSEEVPDLVTKGMVEGSDRFTDGVGVTDTVEEQATRSVHTVPAIKNILGLDDSENVQSLVPSRIKAYLHDVCNMYDYQWEALLCSRFSEYQAKMLREILVEGKKADGPDNYVARTIGKTRFHVLSNANELEHMTVSFADFVQSLGRNILFVSCQNCAPAAIVYVSASSGEAADGGENEPDADLGSLVLQAAFGFTIEFTLSDRTNDSQLAIYCPSQMEGSPTLRAILKNMAKSGCVKLSICRTDVNEHKPLRVELDDQFLGSLGAEEMELQNCHLTVEQQVAVLLGSLRVTLCNCKASGGGKGLVKAILDGQSRVQSLELKLSFPLDGPGFRKLYQGVDENIFSQTTVILTEGSWNDALRDSETWDSLVERLADGFVFGKRLNCLPIYWSQLSDDEEKARLTELAAESLRSALESHKQKGNYKNAETLAGELAKGGDITLPLSLDTAAEKTVLTRLRTLGKQFVEDLEREKEAREMAAASNPSDEFELSSFAFSATTAPSSFAASVSTQNGNENNTASNGTTGRSGFIFPEFNATGSGATTTESNPRNDPEPSAFAFSARTASASVATSVSTQNGSGATGRFGFIFSGTNAAAGSVANPKETGNEAIATFDAASIATDAGAGAVELVAERSASIAGNHATQDADPLLTTMSGRESPALATSNLVYATKSSVKNSKGGAEERTAGGARTKMAEDASELVEDRIAVESTTTTDEFAPTNHADTTQLVGAEEGLSLKPPASAITVADAANLGANPDHALKTVVPPAGTGSLPAPVDFTSRKPDMIDETTGTEIYRLPNELVLYFKEDKRDFKGKKPKDKDYCRKCASCYKPCRDAHLPPADEE